MHLWKTDRLAADIASAGLFFHSFPIMEAPTNIQLQHNVHTFQPLLPISLGTMIGLAMHSLLPLSGEFLFPCKMKQDRI